LSLLTERERREPIDQPTQATTLRVDLCAHQLFERQVQQRPAAIALEHGGEAISYAEVNRRANRLAHLLRERGAGAEDLVGVCLDRSPEAVIAVMAVLKAGAAFVMFGPNLPAGRLAAMLQDASPKLVITTDAHEEKLSGCSVLSLDREWAHIDRQSASNPDCTAALDNAAYAVFTSGSTGRPKAVVVTHRSLANHSLAVSRIYGVSPGDRRVQFGAVGSDIFLSEVFTNLCSGVTLVFCLDRGGNSVAEFLRLIEVHRITLTGLPSSWWAEWAAAMARGDLAIPPSLRLVIVGMEQVNPAALAAFRKAAGDRIRLFNAYGPTETGPTTTIYEAGSSRWEGASLVPIGRPIANTRVYVLDEQQNPVPVGVPGELYIGGDGVARGYLNAPEQTEARFIPDPYDGAQPARRLFRTGDVVFSLPDGNLVFLGRVDRQVKIRGFRVELEEIEAALAEHPDIRQCAVVVRNDQGGERLAAYLTPWSLPGPTPGELRRHLLQRVPDYMLPADFTTLPDMPMTANGKVDRQALPADAPQMQEPERFDVAVTATEKRVAALWQEVLGAAHTSVIANFFESGGDSLRATRLLARIQEEFRRPFPFALFQRGPTITQIAHALDADTPGAPYADTVLARGTQGSRVPLFCITSAADDLYVFRHITSHLDGPQPVFVLNAPIREGEGLRRVEDLAVRVCESIHGIQGSGPYILGGYCFGGILAFEAAQQLLLQGEEVRLVVLFDTPAPGYPRILSSRQRYWDELVSGGVVRTTVREVLAHAKAVGRLLKSRTLANAQNTLVNVGIAAAAVRGKDGVNLVEAAARTYVPKPIDADVAQFIAEDQNVSSRVLEDPRLGWRYLCKRDFRVWRVPGDHITWLREPHARATAELLNRVLGERTEL
jgi:amino acid adenylation domain-containing protein